MFLLHKKMVRNTLKSYIQAKKEAKLLLDYIKLIEQFEINTLSDLIIYQYAIHNSIGKVINEIKSKKNTFSFTIEYEQITPDFIKNIILAKPENQLHSTIRKGYLRKTKPQRNSKNQYK